MIIEVCTSRANFVAFKAVEYKENSVLTLVEVAHFPPLEERGKDTLLLWVVAARFEARETTSVVRHCDFPHLDTLAV